MLNSALAVHRAYREWKQDRRAAPENRIRHRQKIKGEISQKLGLEGGEGLEVIVRDVARMDNYPDANESLWRTSPWFKVEIKGLYHRGLEVVVRLVGVELSRCQAHETVRAGAQTVAVVGRISFDSIVTIDWEGDEHHMRPQIYCWFGKEGPYESVELYRLPNSRGYWESLDLAFKPLRYSLWERWRARRQLSKAQREFDREYGR